MTGKNLFHMVKEITQSERASSLYEFGFDNMLKSKNIIPKPKQPCIFLSHKSEDKAAVIKIGEYIKSHGVDIYLDVDDPVLQEAVKKDDHVAIVQSIQVGIYASTDLMTLISQKTKNSWWVPYEVGFASSEEKVLSSLKLKDVTDLPSFLRITNELKDAQALDKYIGEVKARSTTTKDTFRLFQERQNYVDHPLASYLNINE